jgi:hypothetical protein
MNHTVKLIILSLALLILAGCVNTEKSQVDDISKLAYELSNCEDDCGSINELKINAKLKAQSSGISKEIIDAAELVGIRKAISEKAKIEEIKKIELVNKCNSINKNICYGRCCTESEELYNRNKEDQLRYEYRKKQREEKIRSIQERNNQKH